MRAIYKAYHTCTCVLHDCKTKTRFHGRYPITAFLESNKINLWNPTWNWWPQAGTMVPPYHYPNKNFKPIHSQFTYIQEREHPCSRTQLKALAVSLGAHCLFDFFFWQVTSTNGQDTCMDLCGAKV